MDGAVGSMSTSELGCLIMSGRAAIDSAEARWLLLLAEFDRRSGWAYDGAYDCAAWLVQRCGLGRSTAKERLRVAHELQRRPVLAAAFEAGEVSFSKIRTLTRIVDCGDESDRVFLEVATAGTAADVDRLYRHYKLCQDQETPPGDDSRWERRGGGPLGRPRGGGPVR